MILIKSVMAALGGIAGGIVTQGAMNTSSRWKRVSAIATSGFTGHYVGYVVMLWAIDNYDWIVEGDLMVASAAGFITGAVVPVLYGTVVAILNAIRGNPAKWIQMIIDGIKGNSFIKINSKKSKPRKYEPPQD